MEARALDWISDEEFVLDGVTFRCCGANTKTKSTPERFCILKPRWQIENYEELITQVGPKNVVELGIFDGGSTAFLAQRVLPRKLVAVDLDQRPCAALERFIDEHGFRNVVATHYGIDQADTRTLTETVEREFRDEALDLVIDDASHLLEPTRASFNVLFPRLSYGGAYVIEDWSWTHNTYDDRVPTPLSLFLFELMLVAARRPGVIRELALRKGLAIVRRGGRELDAATFDLSEHYGKLGHELMSNLAQAWAAGRRSL